ncbi:hypothetical protein [Nocardiopsis potens]|uniref:hypothetical protein n=1 Tax=Nocardiopsis potens TaxID=1246458 RepID=UPI0003485430|nr:hypothetical protein [Nocardiopsis potens]
MTAPPAGGIGSIGGGVGAAVAGAQGPVNIGGRQVNVTAPVDLAELLQMLAETAADGDAAGRGGTITAADVERNGRCFVEPGGFPEVDPDGAPPGTLLLTGTPGSGRRGAAMRWLQLAGGAARRARAIRTLPDGGGNGAPLLDQEAVAPGELLYLDASLEDEDGGLLTRLAAELAGYRAAVERSGAWLAVVLDPGQTRALPDADRQEAVSIRRPDVPEVFAAHLRVLGLEPPPGFDPAEWLGSWAGSASVGEAADLALLVRQAQRAAAAGSGFEDWFTDAFVSVADWSEEIGRRLDERRSSAERAVLLSAAVLEGLSAEQVFAGAQRLRAKAAAPEDEEPPLERKGFAARLAELGVGVHADRRVAFTEFRYAAAVRMRFWDDYPWLHEEFEEWIAEYLDEEPLPAGARTAVAERLVEQCLRVGRGDAVLALVGRWASEEGGMTGQAVRALRMLLEDEHAASGTRRWLYAQATSPETPEVRALAVTAVCLEVLVGTHPHQAVVRLHHVARRRGRSQAAEEAARGLVRLAEGDPRLRGAVLHRFADRLAVPGGAHRRTDDELLYRVTDPGVLGRAGRFPADRREAADFRRALAGAMAADRAEAVRHTERWLEAAEEGGLWAEAAGLVAEAGTEAGRGAVLYTAARRWVLAGAGPRERARRRTAALGFRDGLDEARAGGRRAGPGRSTDGGIRA